MKITKYPQSCLLIETISYTFSITPGTLGNEDNTQVQNLVNLLDGYFKQTGHHINVNVLKDLNIPIYSTNEVQTSYPEINVNIVKTNDVIELDNIKIEVVKAVHGYNPKLKNGLEVLENVGYIIDDNKHRLYITSDTICFNNDYKADIVALPVTGYGLTMTSYEASLFAIELGAKLVLPTHMDNATYPTDTKYMEKNFKEFNINYKVLQINQTIEM